MTSNYPIPPFWQFSKLRQPPYLQINMTFCGTGMCLGWKRICCRRGTPTPLPSAPCTHAHRWWLVRLMDPLCIPQLGTYTPTWCPPAECEGVACWQGSPPLKLEGQLERQTPLPGLQDQRLLVLWAPEGVDGRWWWMGYGKLSCGEVRLKIQRGVTLSPSETHKNLLPLSLPQPLPCSPAPQSAGAEPQLQTCRPPPSGN